MKVPPNSGQPPPAPPKGGRPKGLTKRTVKGAAGGMLGVDYEDARRPDPFLHHDDDPSIAEDGADGRRKLQGEGEAERLLVLHRSESSKDNRPDRSAFSDHGRDQESGDLTARTKQKKRIKKARQSKESDEDQSEPSHEEAVELFEDGMDNPDSAGAAGLPDARRADYFQDDASVSPGNLELTDPDEIQRKLGAPMAYAKHIMILTEAFRQSTGANRQEAIEYMASMFLGPSDARFGWAALKEFGHGTGIIDIYPLEVIELIMERYPGHLPKVSFGKTFVSQKMQAETLVTDTATPLILTYPEDRKVRSFAIKGGGRPGYLFEPGSLDGSYSLHIKSPGAFRLLISTLDRAGYSVIDRVFVRVTAHANYVSSVAYKEPYPPRDQARIDEWPRPELGELHAIAPSPKTNPPTAEKRNLMSAADLIHFKTVSAMQGPKTEGTHSPQTEHQSAENDLTVEPASSDVPLAPSLSSALHDETPSLPLLEKDAPVTSNKKNDTQKPTIEHKETQKEESKTGPNFDAPTPWSQEQEDIKAKRKPITRVQSVLSVADKDKIEQAVAAVFDSAETIDDRGAEDLLEEATQRIETRGLASEELEQEPLENKQDYPNKEVEIRPSSISLIREDEEHYTGEETQPMNQEDLEWIFEDPDTTEVSDGSED